MLTATMRGGGGATATTAPADMYGAEDRHGEDPSPGGAWASGADRDSGGGGGGGGADEVASADDGAARTIGAADVRSAGGDAGKAHEQKPNGKLIWLRRSSDDGRTKGGANAGECGGGAATPGAADKKPSNGDGGLSVRGGRVVCSPSGATRRSKRDVKPNKPKDAPGADGSPQLASSKPAAAPTPAAAAASTADSAAGRRPTRAVTPHSLPHTHPPARVPPQH